MLRAGQGGSVLRGQAGRTALLAVVLFAVLLPGGSAPAQPSLGGTFVTLSLTGKPALVVQSLGTLSLFSAGAGSSGALTTTGKVTIDVPAGYLLNSTVPPGTPVGFAVLLTEEGTDQAASFAGIDATLVADDPAHYLSDPQAIACDPGPHQAVWLFAGSILGLRIELPIFVDAPATGEAGTVGRLVFCPPVPRQADGSATQPAPIPLALAFFGFTDILSTQAPGNHVWRAFVTPVGSAPPAPDPSRMFELRSSVPVPDLLTLKARYEAKTGTARLSGKLTGAGKPRRGVRVAIYRITRSAVLAEGAFVGSIRTGASGSYSFRTRVSKTTTFLASVDVSVGSCSGQSSAPAGCITNTVPPPEDARARVLVPRSSA
jgi:hypothetical protein